MDEAAAAEGRAASLHLGYEAQEHLTRRASFVNVVARAVNTSSRAAVSGVYFFRVRKTFSPRRITEMPLNSGCLRRAAASPL